MEENIEPNYLEQLDEGSVLEAEIIEDLDSEINSSGKPIPTDELNPNNPSNHTVEKLVNDNNFFGGASFSDYKPLFDSYAKIFEQQDENCNYLKNCIDILNLQLGKAKRTAWYAILIGLAALIVAIFK